MGQHDNLPNQNSPQSNSSAEDILRNLTQDLQTLQRTLASQLSQDINQLQSQKRQLMDDIEALEGDYEQLQTRFQTLQNNHEGVLSQQQQAQQQLWAKRLAQALATHLHARLAQTLSASASATQPNNYSALPQTHQVLASLDTTLHTTLQSLQQDLNSYQSSLSQQVGRMHSLEQQGEVILEALVNRLSQQLQTQMTLPQEVSQQNGHGPLELPQVGRPMAFQHPLSTGNGYYATPAPNPVLKGVEAAYPEPITHASVQPAAPLRAPRQPRNLQRGLVFMLLATLAVAFHHVIVGMLSFGSDRWGQGLVSGLFPLTLPNALMLVWLRMVVLLPLACLGAGRLYPDVWRDIQDLSHNRDRRPLFHAIASGVFLLLSQVLIYKAIAAVGPGIAVTLLFIYPLMALPLSWFLFANHKPTALGLVVLSAITMGAVFTALPPMASELATGGSAIEGVGAAILASAAFALFLICIQLSQERLHPVPVSLIQFATIFVLSSLILMVGTLGGLRPDLPSNPTGLYLGGLLLGGLALLAYLLTHYGIQLMGAAQASIVPASEPIVTSVLAYLILPGEKSTLQFIQWVGVTLVTLGVISLSFEGLAQEKREANRKRSQMHR